MTRDADTSSHPAPAAAAAGGRVGPYFALACGWSCAWQLPALLAARDVTAAAPPAWLTVVAAFGPLLAAVIVLRGEGGDGFRAWRQAWRWPRGRRAQLLTWVSPWLPLAVAALLASPRGGATTGLAARDLGSVAGLWDLVVVAGLLQGLGEEPGWRGFLLPRLRATRGPVAATLLLFPLWLCWHVPFFHSRPALGAGQAVAFSAGILAAAAWLTLVREWTGSIAAAVTWHALINVSRGVALALSPAAFLVHGGVVTAGAVAILLAAVFRGRRAAA
jgi:membrane protease YdiL (CAAX protease family)